MQSLKLKRIYQTGKIYKPNEIPTATDVVGWNEVARVQGQVAVQVLLIPPTEFTTGAHCVVQSFPPFIAGSNEFTAETSSNSQTRFNSVRIASGQETVKDLIEWSIRRFNSFTRQ